MSDLDQTPSIPIVQVISTIQGEGPYLGTPSLLIRVGGCNLSCPFCDSWELHNKQVKETSIFGLMAQIVDSLKTYNFKNIMITGGEPFKYPHFIKRLIKDIMTDIPINTIEIETNGTLIYETIDIIFGDLKIFDSNKIRLNISPKLDVNAYGSIANFEREIISLRMGINALKYLNVSYRLKFIYTKKMEHSIINFLTKLDNYSKPVYIMPMTGKTITEKNYSMYLQDMRKSALETIDFCMRYGFTYTPREHLYLFGDKKDEFEGT